MKKTTKERKEKKMKIEGVKTDKEQVKNIIKTQRKMIGDLRMKVNELSASLRRVQSIDTCKNDMLFNMFEMQQVFQSQKLGKLKDKMPIDSVDDFRYSMLALVTEIGEVLTADKRWKNSRNDYFDWHEKREELVDCMAFLLNAILFSGIYPADFYNDFVSKWNKNMQRVTDFEEDASWEAEPEEEG